MSSRVNVVTGNAVSTSMRRIADPVISIRSIGASCARTTADRENGSSPG